MTPIELEGNEGAAMRLGILFARLERKEHIESYPVSKWEIERLPNILNSVGKGYFYQVKESIDPYWSFFSAKYIGELSLN